MKTGAAIVSTAGAGAESSGAISSAAVRHKVNTCTSGDSSTA